MSEKVLHEWTFGPARMPMRIVAEDTELGPMDRFEYRSAAGKWTQVPERFVAFSCAREFAALAAENAKLRACVKAADAMRKCLSTEEWPRARRYDAARAEVKP